MNTIKLTKDEIIEIIEDNTTKLIKETPTKHDCSSSEYVFAKDDKFYMFDVEYSYNDGLQIYGDTIATEVKQVEKIVKVWETVE